MPKVGKGVNVNYFVLWYCSTPAYDMIGQLELIPEYLLFPIGPGFRRMTKGVNMEPIKRQDEKEVTQVAHIGMDYSIVDESVPNTGPRVA